MIHCWNSKCLHLQRREQPLICMVVVDFQWFLWTALFPRWNDCTVYIFNTFKKTSSFSNPCMLKMIQADRYIYMHSLVSFNMWCWRCFNLTRPGLWLVIMNWPRTRGKSQEFSEDIIRRVIDLHNLGRAAGLISKQLQITWEEIKMFSNNPGTTKPQACCELETAGTLSSMSTAKPLCLEMYWSSHWRWTQV